MPRDFNRKTDVSLLLVFSWAIRKKQHASFTKRVVISILKRKVLNSSPQLAEIHQAQGQKLIKSTKERRVGKWGGWSSCCHDIFNSLIDHWHICVTELYDLVFCMMRDASLFDSIFKKQQLMWLLSQQNAQLPLVVTLTQSMIYEIWQALLSLSHSAVSWVGGLKGSTASAWQTVQGEEGGEKQRWCE